MLVSTDSTVPALVAGFMHADIVRRSDHLRIGPFLVGLNPHTASLGHNYAIPLTGASPSQAVIAELVSVFERHHRTPRLECVTGAAPQAEAAGPPLDKGFSAVPDAAVVNPLWRCLRRRC